MRIGRSGPFSRQAQARSVCGLRVRWKAAHDVSTWLRLSWSSGGKFCAVCILNHLFASLRVEDDSVEITGVAGPYAPAFEVSFHAGLRRTVRYLSGITPRHSEPATSSRTCPILRASGLRTCTN